MHLSFVILLAAGSAGLLVPRTKHDIDTPPPRDVRREPSVSASLLCHETLSVPCASLKTPPGSPTARKRLLSDGTSPRVSPARKRLLSDGTSPRVSPARKRLLSDGTSPRVTVPAESVEMKPTASVKTRSKTVAERKRAPVGKVLGKGDFDDVSSVKRPRSGNGF